MPVVAARAEERKCAGRRGIFACVLFACIFAEIMILELQCITREISVGAKRGTERKGAEVGGRGGEGVELMIVFQPVVI